MQIDRIWVLRKGKQIHIAYLEVNKHKYDQYFTFLRNWEFISVFDTLCFKTSWVFCVTFCVNTQIRCLSGTLYGVILFWYV